MLEFLATLVMAAYYWDWLLHIALGPAVALFLYFCISSAASGYLRVFVSGIFPCRPVLLTLGLGHSVGLDESLRALAQISAQCKPLQIVPSYIVFVQIIFLYCYILLYINILTLAQILAQCKPLGTIKNTVQAFLIVFVTLMYLCKILCLSFGSGP